MTLFTVSSQSELIQLLAAAKIADEALHQYRVAHASRHELTGGRGKWRTIILWEAPEEEEVIWTPAPITQNEHPTLRNRMHAMHEILTTSGAQRTCQTSIPARLMNAAFTGRRNL
jgi:hypothetical protein